MADLIMAGLELTDTYCSVCSRETKHQIFCKVDVSFIDGDISNNTKVATIWGKASQCLSCGNYVDLQGKQPVVNTKTDEK